MSSSTSTRRRSSWEATRGRTASAESHRSARTGGEAFLVRKGPPSLLRPLSSLGDSRGWLGGLLDGPESGLIFPEVLLQGEDDPLHVPRADNHARVDLSGGGKDAHEVEDEFLASVGHLHAVGVDASQDVVGELDLDRRGGLGPPPPPVGFPPYHTPPPPPPPPPRAARAPPPRRGPRPPRP